MLVAGVTQDIEGYLVSRLGRVRNAPGYERRVDCPFCGDNKGHLYVNCSPDEQPPGPFICFKCNRKGTLYDILRHFGDELPREPHDEDFSARRRVLEAATLYYHNALTDPDSVLAERATTWLVGKRGLTPETIATYQLGVATGGLRRHLRSLDFSLSEITLTGLVRDDGRDFFDDGAVIIPYFASGVPVLVRGKYIDGLYLTPEGQKARLYNTDILLRKCDEVAIVEGEGDALILNQMGIPAVGVPGAGIWFDTWTDYLSSCKKIFICFDRDPTGIAGAQKLKKLFGAKARIVKMPAHEGDGKGKRLNYDPTEWLVEKGHTKQDFLELLRKTDRESLPFRRASTYDPKPLEFFWGDRIPLGKVTVLSGIGGFGKSFLTLALAAAVTNGGSLKDDKGQRLDGEVLMLSYEDDIEDTIVPRAMALGVDLDRLHLLDPNVDSPEGLRPFGPQDVETYIEQPLLSNPEIRLVIIDPIGSFYPANTDTNAETAVRGALKSIVDAAARTRAAVVIVAHNKKGNAGNALHQIAGSQAIGAFARSALMIGQRDGVLMVAHSKSNVAALASTLSYSIEGGVFQWGGLVPGITADELAEPNRVRGPKTEVSNFLPAAEVNSVETFRRYLNQRTGTTFAEILINRKTNQSVAFRDKINELRLGYPWLTWDDLVQFVELLRSNNRHPRTWKSLLELFVEAVVEGAIGPGDR